MALFSIVTRVELVALNFHFQFNFQELFVGFIQSLATLKENFI